MKRKNKRYMHLIVMLLLLAVTVSAYFVVKTIVDNQAKIEAWESDDGKTTYSFIAFDLEKVEEITITVPIKSQESSDDTDASSDTDASGGTDSSNNTDHTNTPAAEESFKMVKNGDEWTIVGYEELKIDEEILENLLLALSNMTSTNWIKDVLPSGLKVYGLDTPDATVSVKDSTNGIQTFYIGDYNSFSGSYYVTTNKDKTSVFDVADIGELFCITARDVVVWDSIPAIAEQSIDKLYFNIDGANKLTYTYYPGGKAEETDEDEWYKAQDGGEEQILDSDTAEIMSEFVCGLAFKELIEIDDTRKSELGLSAPVEMTVQYYVTEVASDTNGDDSFVDVINKKTFYIGGPSGEASLYVMIEGSDIIYSMESELLCSIIEEIKK